VADVDGTPLIDIVREAVLDALDSMPKPRRRDPDAVAESLRRAVRSALGAAWKKKPICHIHVLTL
jgi:ribonuclease J